MRFCPTCGSRFSNDARYCPVDGQPTEQRDTAPPPSDPMIGLVVDQRYRIERAIGEGGMGIVYLATHVTLKKRMAVKVLRGEMARDPDVVQRFIQEAQASSAIGHANIIDISDFGRLPDGSVYFVMEYLEGQSLTDLVARSGRVPFGEALAIVEMIASALAAAHQRGIVHRDLKPDNIFLVTRGATRHFVKVLDFGIAKVGNASSKLTKTGMVFGTPHYMSPEQAAGQSVDSRTDIYALGVIVYEMCTGTVPFDADTFMGILTKHMFEPPKPPAAGELGPLEPIVLRALAKKPEQRYQSMEELLADLSVVKAGGAVATHADPAPVPTPFQRAPVVENVEEPIALPTRGPSGRVIALGVVAGLLVFGGIAGGIFAMAHRAPPQVERSDTASPVATAPKVESSAAIAAPSTAPTATQAASAPTPVAAMAPEPTPAAPPSPERPETEDAPAAPERAAVVSIASTPVDAEAYVDGVLVGRTPLSVPRPKASPIEVELRSNGYRAHRVAVSSTSDPDLRVVLEREVAVARVPRMPRVPRPPTSASPSATTPPPSHGAAEVIDPWGSN